MRGLQRVRLRAGLVRFASSFETAAGNADATAQPARFSPEKTTADYFAGTRCFSSVNQLSTTLICVAADDCSTSLTIRNRWPSEETP